MIKRVYIEITNVCSLNCSFCRKNHRKPRFMSIAEFEHVLSQTEKLTKYIYLHVQGEPLLHPDLNQIMAITEKHACHVQLVTNALSLKEHMDLSSYKALRKISFSLQSIEYHDKDVHDFMEPVLQFIEQASANGHPYCELRFWRDDQMELPRTGQCLKLIKDRYPCEESGRKNNFRILPGVYVDHSNPFTWPDPDETAETERGTCLGGVEQLAVLSDGTVIPCCLDGDGMINLGNLFTESLDQILNSERYLNLTDGFRKDQLSESLCRKCTFRKRFDKQI